MATSIASLKTKIARAFPQVWVKDGAEFDGRKKSLWTGEGSSIGGIPAFDSYNHDYYIMGVHPMLEALLTKNGYYAEAYDGGTYFIYKI